MGLFKAKPVVVTTAEKLDSAVEDASNALVAFEDAAIALELSNDSLDEIEEEVQGHIAGYKTAIALEEDKLDTIAQHRERNAATAAKIREIFSLHS